MIKWLFGLIIKSHKPIKEQLADAQDRLYDQEYKRGWDYAVLIWGTTPVMVAKMELIKAAGNIETAFEIAIYDFLKERTR
ncbi:hypothetical protein HYP99_gp024 [Sinorhizobium phage ort11]|uniref:Uncharacterized protein n=1 Tax=Sinorhizobium phage ort11 TaxID=2599764 RepID=A0A5C2H5H9_9CAUD|nr:hypothetical protein HYP99_gp024 [Sinorhizobium phage ort11]QEP29822.1 hypothetical protein Smphiort11_024 [Sinorhizobium phage ort11]